jgi:hypothetical protein
MLTLREVIRERSLVFAGAPHDVYAGLLVTLDLEIPQSNGCTQQGHAASRHDTFLDRGASSVQSILHAGLLFLHFGLGRLNQGALSWRQNETPTSPPVPGNTDAERMDNAVRKMFSVSKEEVLRREGNLKRSHAKRKQAKPPK